MKTLGARIAHYRKAAGLSQAELATACGWKSQSRIGNYEKDTREPTLADLEKIATALGMSVSQLAYGDHVKIPQPALAAEIARIAQAAPAAEPEPARAGQAEADQGAQEVAHCADMLAIDATPRSREILWRIAMAANEGRLTEDDLNLLDQIAARFESRKPDAATTPARPHQRLREKLKRND